MSFMKKIVSLIYVFLITQIIPFISTWVANVFKPFLDFGKPFDNFISLSIHHLLQLFLTIILLKIYFKETLADVGFNLKNKNQSIIFFKWFMGIWLLITILFYLIALKYFHGFSNYISGFCPADLKHMATNLIFNAILPGIGEEPLFRAFVILALVKYWSGMIKIRKFSVTHVALISGFIFMVGHINYNIYPFQITYFDPLQLCFTFALGVLWASVFEKTRSLLCPVLAHNSANVIQYTIGYLTSFLLK